jgi:hypothetical protein
VLPEEAPPVRRVVSTQVPLVGGDSVTDIAVTGPVGEAVEGAALDGAAEPEPRVAPRPLNTRAHSPTARLAADTVVVTE